MSIELSDKASSAPTAHESGDDLIRRHMDYELNDPILKRIYNRYCKTNLPATFIRKRGICID